MNNNKNKPLRIDPELCVIDHNNAVDWDANNASTVYGTQILDTSDLSSFTAFADLTNDQITGWVESAIGEDEVTELKTNVSNQIAELVTPTQKTKTIGE